MSRQLPVVCGAQPRTIPGLRRSGSISSESATVTLHGDPNYGTASRSGTMTIAGQTFTITQTGAAMGGDESHPAAPFRPAAAAYSRTLDRIIFTSTGPSQLHIYDPATGVDRTVALPLVPTSLSVGPDGLHAAVGHDQSISYVNLSTALLEQRLNVSATVYSLALTASEVYAFPLSGTWQPVHAVTISTGLERLFGNIRTGEHRVASIRTGDICM